MAIEYTWSVKQMERNTSDGGVISVHWGCTAIDGDVSWHSRGVVEMAPDPASSGFIPFEDLTQDIVLGWVWSSDDFDKAFIEAALYDKVEAEKNPPITTGLPWD